MKLRGLIPAVHTPLHEDGALNLPKIPELAETVLADKPAAVYVLGSTGEGPSLSTPERKSVAEAWISAVGGRVPVIVQIGHSSLAESVELGEHAASQGAAATSAAPPSYFPFGRAEELIASYAAIAGSAPDLPFYTYHIPRLTGVGIDPTLILKAADDRIPNLAGVKFSSFELWQLQECIKGFSGRFNILFGSDEMLLSGMAAGADGAIGSTYTYALPIYRKVIEALESGNMEEARQWQWRSVQMVGAITKRPAMAAIKACMKIVGGVDAGPVRLPLQRLTETQEAELAMELDDLGVRDWLKEARA
jgi:N-acetylneuraminate lyase